MDAESTVAPINTDAEENSTDETDSDDSIIPPNRFMETPRSSTKSVSTDEIVNETLVSTLHLYQVHPRLEFYQQQLNHPRKPTSFRPL